MKRFLAAASLAGLLLSAAPALAGQQDFVLVNRTGYALNEVYVSPAKTADWEEDVLGQDVLQNGQRVRIRFDRDTDACLWDLKVVYEDEETAEWGALNLCEISVVAISYDSSSGDTSAEVE